MQSFLKGLFLSLKEELQVLKCDLSRDLKEVRHKLEAVEKRVATLEEHEHNRDKEIKQEEVICLQEQQIMLQAHTADLENCWRLNNICIRRDTMAAEEDDIVQCVSSLFRHILGEDLDNERGVSDLQIAAAFRDFYRDLYTPQRSNIDATRQYLNGARTTQLLVVDAAPLEAPIRKEEVMLEVARLDALKSPGTDGFPSLF
ncbi:hypothetical protein NDU88_005270 [Pleurodeles waltl]|uniref:Uncharacterized protein n=1 Tax=Pleurodeles waltl TaxID=8319 RepID=A0AAV7W7D2_PLEWA|nr:hypothetical protein NDU88_005270 [Pleurodeles waltl]